MTGRALFSLQLISLRLAPGKLRDRLIQFAAAVSVNGVSNMVSMCGTSDVGTL